MNGVAAQPQEATAKTSPSLAGEVRAVGRHSLVYLVGPAVSNAIGFVLIPVYTFYIDRSHFGVMTLIDVLMTMAMMILALGMSDGLARFYYAESNERERRRLVCTALLTPACIGLPCIVCAMLLSPQTLRWFQIDSSYTDYLRWSWLAAWFSMLAELDYAYLRLKYRAKTFVAITVGQIVAAISLNLLFVVAYRWGIRGILYSTLLTQGVVGGGLTVVILVANRAWPSVRHLIRLLGFGIHLVPSIVSLQLTNYVSPWMIRWLLLGDSTAVLGQVATFSMGQKLGVVVNRFVTVPFHAFWRPRRMELMVHDSPEVRRILARICTYSTCATAQVALLLSVVAEPLLQLLVNRSYWDAHAVVPWIAAGYVILGLEHHFSTGMQIARRTWWATIVGLVSLAVLVATNWVTLPRYGVQAAAIGTVFSVTIRSFGFLWVSQAYHPIPFELRRLAQLACVSIVLFGVATQITTHHVVIDVVLRCLVAMGLGPCLIGLSFFTPAELTACRTTSTTGIARARQWMTQRWHMQRGTATGEKSIVR